MRLGWVLVTILTVGPGILIYLVMAFIMPVGRPETAQESAYRRTFYKARSSEEWGTISDLLAVALFASLGFLLNRLKA